ncbi:hypothetical protein GMDG_07181 [Pseudogymnoascus destructans 20631-21]|uniref:Uncharacterized protein n=1 Tax=Pseudogymnoascus destructans (strain ATCC MYA-4855 / 20631-21) TaxID=658429 RepID=L8FX86_PSED2|nr:hypothetical protein GMDG_07181 [Pseudogymnoascus destructans 20631-21]
MPCSQSMLCSDKLTLEAVLVLAAPLSPRPRAPSPIFGSSRPRNRAPVPSFPDARYCTVLYCLPLYFVRMSASAVEGCAESTARWTTGEHREGGAVLVCSGRLGRRAGN